MTPEQLKRLLKKNGIEDYQGLMKLMNISKRTAMYWLAGGVVIPPNQIKLLKMLLEKETA